MNKAMKSKSAETASSVSEYAAGCFAPADGGATARPVWFAAPETLDDDLEDLSEAQRAWLKNTGWTPEPGAVALLPDADGALAGAVLGLGAADHADRTPLIAGALPPVLPEGDYRLASKAGDPGLAALGWALGCYGFTRYKSQNGRVPHRLVLPEGADERAVARMADAVAFGRDLINTPANDLGPAELEAAAREMAERFGAEVAVTTGDDLLKKNFPLIHAVGRASDRPPRLIDIAWGDANAPRVTLVGKGICYDTGGLSLKPTKSMALMKKDMGGAASVLSLAAMIMDARLPVRLRVLVPAADNSVSANAYRPGDVLPSRNGMSVEIGNTDAEGRLVLADALALADEEEPDYLVTMATLTGAARVALGPDLPPLYATDDEFAGGLLASASRVDDPLWRMPFWRPYDKLLKGRVGDVSHISEGSFAGSVTAAMFLRRFVAHARRYAHLDIYGWVPVAKPARPEGGEPQGARALFDYFSGHFR